MTSPLKSANEGTTQDSQDLRDPADDQFQYRFPVSGPYQLVGRSSMKTRNDGGSDGSNGLYYPQSKQEMTEFSYYVPQNIRTLDQLSPSDGFETGNFPVQTSQGQYCTLESAPATSAYATYNSPSISFSQTGSPTSQQDCQSYPSNPHHSPDNTYGSSPICGSCTTDDINDLQIKLRELETAMLGPDSDIVDSFESGMSQTINVSLDPDMWQVIEMPRRDLKQVLVACARAISDDDMMTAHYLMAELRQMVSVSGDPIERLGAYLLEGLVARLNSSGSCIYKGSRCKEPASSDLLSYMHLLYEVCPYFKFGYMSANGAIAEAVKDENKVHIVDFQIAQGSQWVTLIQALAARPGGPPKIRITGVDDSVSAYARGGGLQIVGQRLSRLAEMHNVPFEFHAVAMSGCEVEIVHLGVRPGEALVVNFPFMLHHMPDESVSTENHRDRLLRMVKSLSPTVVTLVEQESNTNTAPFFPRFVEVLNYYTAIFESLDVTLPRENKERISVEQHCLACDIVNIIACEGAERVERHEVLGKWRSRFTMAGFTPYPLSSVVNATIKCLLEKYCEHYRLEERDGALYLGWMSRALVVACAWR